MIQRKIYLLLLFSLLSVGLLLSACDQVVIGPAGSTAGPTSSLTTFQVLQNSVNAMKQLKSSHISLQSNLQGSNTATATPSAATPSSSIAVTPTAMPGNVSLSIMGTGDQALPDQEQLNLTINQGIKVAEIVQGDKVYVQNAQGQWYVLNKGDFTGLTTNPFAGVNFDQNTLLGLIQHAQIVDHADENLNGQSLRHITANLDKEGLRQLLLANPQLQRLFGQQNIDALLNNAKSFLASIDVWIDETQFYIHRMQLKLNLVASTDGLDGNPPSNVSVSLATTVDQSNFNTPVTITPPANAIPTNNPGSIIGLGNP
ncbi:MAG TPA: hypothetical protein VKR06_04760 [Ktedonosporobacter sp.]|nr:hypothetical protein [Ktedonosporobacter sp.]